MKTYNDIVKKAYDRDMGEDMMWKMTDATNSFIESMRVLHPAETHKFITDLENMVCYPPLTEEEAKSYVAGMINKDGSKGEHWTLEQTNKYLENHSEYANLNKLDFYVAINMMYSDYFKPAGTTDNYASMAKDFIADADAPSNKVKRYMVAMN